MAQLAFVKFDSIEQAGPTGVLQITFVFQGVWVGDQLAGGFRVRVLADRTITNATLATAVQNDIIGQAAARGVTITSTDIKLIGGTVF